jgi:hypothetical protein
LWLLEVQVVDLADKLVVVELVDIGQEQDYQFHLVLIQ